MARVQKKKDKGEVFKASIPLFDHRGKEIDTLALNKELFTGKVHQGALHQAIVAYNANQRQGTASTKTISEVSGGGKKPWAQKGSGRARHGTIRSPLWRHGGIIFGPHPRDYRQRIPKKIKRLALISALNSKLREKNIMAIDSLHVDEPKTKKFRVILDALKLEGKTLFIVDTLEEATRRASRNIREVAITSYRDFSVADLLASNKVVVAHDALAKLEERLRAQ